MNWSTPGVNKPTLVERLWAWLMLALMIAVGAIVFTAAVLIHDARAEETGPREWYYHQHSCTLQNKDPIGQPLSSLNMDDVIQIQKLIPDLKRCSAFYDCVSELEQGKVKHCYYNDKRWKRMFAQ